MTEAVETLQQTPYEIAIEICRRSGLNWKIVQGPGQEGALVSVCRMQIVERLWMDGHGVSAMAQLLNLHPTSIRYYIQVLENKRRKRRKAP